MKTMSAADLRKHIDVNDKGQKTLDLSQKRLKKIPNAVMHVRRLEVLNLLGNKLTELPPDMNRLTDLVEFDATMNELTSLPDSIGDLRKLVALKVTNNQITEVPTSVTHLRKLEKLYLSRNNLVKLPDNIGNLKSLHTLKLEHNHLSALPASITALSNLRYLELGYNKLQELPTNVGVLQSLTVLNAKCSQLSAIPTSLTTLGKLEQLMLGGNNLTGFPEGIGDLGSSLTVLDAANNRITALPESFSRLRKLERLELNENKLEELPKNFTELTSLTFLNVTDNPLRSESIRRVADLKEINVQKCAKGSGNICFLFPLTSPPPDHNETAPELVLSLKDSDKTLVLQETLKEEGGIWDLREAAARVTFPPQAVAEPLEITCSLWNPETLSPPLGEQEALVSNVLELSRDGAPSLEFDQDFSKEVTLALSHSATELEGYEVVIKQLIDKENNEWNDLKTTSTWFKSGQANPPASSGTHEILLPFAEAKVTQCSCFVVIWRLKSFIFSEKVVLAAPAFSFTVPEYPSVRITFPEGAIQPTEHFTLNVKVQDVPQEKLKEKGVFAGLVLHLSCSQSGQFQVPVTIAMPVSLRRDENDIPDLSNAQLRVFYQTSSPAASEWRDVTHELQSPVDLRDGVVTFQVNHFSVFWTWFDWCHQPISSLLYCASVLYKSSMPQEAAFLSCLCDTGFYPTLQLALCCYPIHVKERVKKDILSSNIVRRLGEGNSLQLMCKGDVANLSLLTALELLGDAETERYYLRFLGDEPFLRSDPLVLVKEEGIPQVRFIRRRDDQQQNEELCSLTLSPLPQADLQLVTRQVRAADQLRPLKSGRLTDEDMLLLAADIIEEWKRLGMALGLSSAEVTEVDIDERLVRDKAYQVLLKWKQKFGSDATYRRLSDGLTNIAVERIDLVDKYCCN